MAITLGEFRDFTKDRSDDSVISIIAATEQPFAKAEGMMIAEKCNDGRDYIVLTDYKEG